MASEVILPRVDMDMESGAISQWLVGEGEAVEKGQVLFEIETDKAAMEIEAEAAGVIRGLSNAVGEKVPVGTVVAWICAPDEDFSPAEESAGTGHSTQADVGGQAGAGSRASSEQARSETGADDSSGPAARGNEPSVAERPRATPLARRIARQNDLDLAQLDGSGPRGRIQHCDVAAALDALHKRHRGAEGRPVSQQARAAGEYAGLRTLREGRGTPVLMVHGFGGEANSWRPLVGHLGLEGPILAIDLPGHGRQGMPERIDFDALVVFAEDALREAGLDAFHLVGHSLGGAVSARVAGSGVFDVRSLTLIAPAGLGPAINGEFLEGFVTAEGEEATAAWMRLLVHAPSVITPGLVRATLRSNAGQRDAQARLREAVFPHGTQIFDIRADLAGINAPARVLVGSEDRIIPSNQAQALPPAIALHRLAGVGHMPQIEVPELTGLLIAQTVRSAG